jgi:hypothetical protein
MPRLLNLPVENLLSILDLVSTNFLSDTAGYFLTLFTALTTGPGECLVCLESNE